MRHAIETDEASTAVDVYSQAMTNGSLLYMAGQIPLTLDGESLDDEGITTQTTQSLDNVTTILAEAGADATDVLKTTVLLADINDFDEMNKTYATCFDKESLARPVVEVGNLPKGVDVEIEAAAVVDEE